MDSRQSFINDTKILYQLENSAMSYSKCYAKHNSLCLSLIHPHIQYELSSHQNKHGIEVIIACKSQCVFKFQDLELVWLLKSVLISWQIKTWPC